MICIVCPCLYPLVFLDNRNGDNINYIAIPNEILQEMGEVRVDFEEVREKEVSRALRKYKLSDNEKNVIDMVTKSILKKIIHYPVTNLRMTEDKELKKRYSEDLMYLFQLGSEDVYQKYFRKKDNRKTVGGCSLKGLPSLQELQVSVKPGYPSSHI